MGDIRNTFLLALLVDAFDDNRLPSTRSCRPTIRITLGVSVVLMIREDKRVDGKQCWTEDIDSTAAT